LGQSAAIASVQAVQKVHSKLHIKTLSPHPRGVPQPSHRARISRAIAVSPDPVAGRAKGHRNVNDGDWPRATETLG